MSARTDPVEAWIRHLETRHLRELTFAEVRRAVQALSSLYVERRRRLHAGAALDGAGKRAAFALYYGPLHFLLLREIVRALDLARSAAGRILDLGCGSGVAGAALALETGARASIEGIDRSAFAVEEARFTYRCLGVRGSARTGDLARARLDAGTVVAAFAVNELEAASREALRERLLDAAAEGARILVVEPIARGPVSWWSGWESEFLAAGGRADAWRFPVELPSLLRRFDEAAGLDHRELTGRSLLLATRARRGRAGGASA